MYNINHGFQTSVSTSLITWIPCLVKINFIKFSSQLLHSLRLVFDLLCGSRLLSISSKLAQLLELFIVLVSSTFFIQTSFLISFPMTLWSPELSVTILTAWPGCFMTGTWVWLLKESVVSIDILSNLELRLKRLLLQMYKQFVGLGESIVASVGDGVRNTELGKSFGVRYLLHYPMRAWEKKLKS